MHHGAIIQISILRIGLLAEYYERVNGLRRGIKEAFTQQILLSRKVARFSWTHLVSPEPVSNKSLRACLAQHPSWCSFWLYGAAPPERDAEKKKKRNHLLCSSLTKETVTRSVVSWWFSGESNRSFVLEIG